MVFTNLTSNLVTNGIFFVGTTGINTISNNITLLGPISTTVTAGTNIVIGNNTNTVGIVGFGALELAPAGALGYNR